MKRRVKPTGKAPKARAPGGAGRGFWPPAKPPGEQNAGGWPTPGPAAKRRARPRFDKE